MAQIAGRVKEIIEQTKTSVTFDEILAEAEARVEDDVLGSQVAQLLHLFCKALHHRFECRLIYRDE